MIEKSMVLKDVELRVLSELMKNARISDRDLAKKLRVSQPTVTRARHSLEKGGYIKGYLVMPDLQKLGYQISAITFVRFKEGVTGEEAEKLRKRAEEKFRDESYASNVVMFERGMGLGYTGVIVSFHENYTSYAKFLEMIKHYPVLEPDIRSFLTDLNDKVQYRRMTFAPLANHILTLGREGRES